MSIKAIINTVIEVEGGYVFHEDDLGGATCYGITEAVARANGYQGNMRDLPRSIAYQIYLNKYVIEPGFGRVEAINALIAEELVDTGVNMGPEVAAKFLQRTLNVLNNKGQYYPDIAVDGHVGNKTLQALQALIDKRGRDIVLVVVTMLNSLQGARYIELCEAREQNESFVYGWFRHRVVI